MSEHSQEKEWFEQDAAQITRELVDTTKTSRRLRNIIVGLLAVGALGIGALIAKMILDGAQADWGYVAAVFSFVVSFSTAAPVLYIGAYWAKGYWGRAISRIASLFILGGVVSAILLIPLVIQLPSLYVGEENILRRSIWFESPAYSPHVWAFVALGTIIVAGIALLYVNAMPDLAVMRENSTGWRQRWATRLARGWIGTDVQWRVVRAMTAALVLIYMLAAGILHIQVASDFSMSLVPGWRDAIYPVYHFVTAIQLGISALIIACYIAIRYGTVAKYLTKDHFWNMGRFLFANTLGWIYLFFSGFFVFWYGRNSADSAVLDITVRGPFLWAMILTVLFAFIFPWWWLIWNKVRNSITGPVVGACLVVIGIFFDRLRLFVPPWSVPESQINARFLRMQYYPDFVAPDVFDVLILAGSLALVIALILMVTRLVPIIPIWQALEYKLLVRPVKYVRAHGILIAKSD